MIVVKTYVKQTNEGDLLPLEAFVDDNQNDDDEHSKVTLSKTKRITK